MVISDHARRQTRSCSNAKALAAVRDETPSLAKMFCRWRATVCSLMTNSSAIARLLFPAAANRSTSSSRALRPWVSTGVPTCASDSSRARSGVAPSSFEDAASRLELHRGRVLVSQGAAGQPQEHSQLCRFVRALQLLPRTPGIAKRTQGGLGVALGQSHGSSGPGGHRPKRLASLRSRDLVEFATGDARDLDVADGQHDLDVGGQQLSALQRLDRLAHRPADRSGPGLAVALRKPQQGQTGLRFAPAPARVLVGGLGRVEFAPQPMDLPLPVMGLAARQLIQDSLVKRSAATRASARASAHAP